MQQLILKTKCDEFMREVNDLLMDGWQVVPGTLVISSMRVTATEGTPKWFILPDGTTIFKNYCVVVENPNAT